MSNPKIGDRITDHYGYLEVTSVDEPRQLCIVKRGGGQGVLRNPFVMKYEEFRKRKTENDQKN